MREWFRNRAGRRQRTQDRLVFASRPNRRSNCGRRLLSGSIAAFLLSLAALSWFIVGPSGGLAVDGTSSFELEGNILGNDSAGPDWADIFDSNGNVVNLFGGVDAAFIADDLSTGGLTDETVFAQDNKNNDLIADWNWKTGNNPPKDDLVNVYAYGVFDGTDFIIYGGLERLAPEGDSHVDFQFYRQAIGLDNTPPCPTSPSPPCDFTGEKTDGDLMVAMDFTVGGTIGTVRIFEWNGSTEEYDLIATLVGGGCNGADTICAFNNSGSISGGPWPNFTGQQGNPTDTLPANTFTELGVNVSDVVGPACISSFMAKTRTSQSINSELKDFGPPEAFELCDLEVTKTGDNISKVGDDVDYTITIQNTGAITLFRQSIEDTLLGDLTDGANPFVTSNTCVASLAPGSSCTITATRTVLDTDDDPLENTVTAVYDSDAGLSGAEVTNSDSHSVNLFQPSIVVTKTGDTLSEVGAVVNYTIEVCNTSSSDTPTLIKDSVTDSLTGPALSPDVNGSFGASLPAPPGCESHDFTRTVQAGDPNPLVNTATALYHPDGFTNDITDSDDHSVSLPGPGVQVTKTGDLISKATDDVTYTIEICNTGDIDLIEDVIEDSVLGDLSASYGDTVSVNECESHDFTRTVQAGDPDPLVNTVEVHYHPQGLTNDVTNSDSHIVELFQPSFTLSKACSPSSASVGDTITYTFIITNTSSADSPDLNRVSVSDSLLGDIADSFPASLAPGESATVTLTRDVQSGDPNPLANTVTAVYQVEGFPNQLSQSAGCSVSLVAVAAEEVTPTPTPTPTPSPTPAVAVAAALPAGGGPPGPGDGSGLLVNLLLTGAGLVALAWFVWALARRREADSA